MRLHLILASALLAAACSERPPTPATPAPPPQKGPGTTTPAASTTIEGVVHLTGQPPPPVQVTVPLQHTPTCGAFVEQPRAVVGEGGGLAEVVVWVSGAHGPLSAAPPPPLLDQRGCVFSPRVLAVAQDAQLTVTNSDPLLHNVRSAGGTNHPFNTAMPITGMKVQVPAASTPSVTRVTCDVHPWMLAFVRTFDHPYFGTTDEAGRFTIRGAPPGKATLRLWHPFLGEQRAEVDIPENGVARPQIDWPAQ